MKISKEKFELHLADKGLLIVEFCEIAEINKASLRLALSNKGQTRPATVGKIARALGVPVESIIVKEGD